MHRRNPARWLRASGRLCSVQKILDFAGKHRDMIAKYGRFPARNAALARADRPGEEDGIKVSKDW